MVLTTIINEFHLWNSTLESRAVTLQANAVLQGSLSTAENMFAEPTTKGSRPVAKASGASVGSGKENKLKPKAVACLPETQADSGDEHPAPAARI
ncbi:hypothetical protein KIN20_020882 [Parelaphostrongylus tenuis]|uniref:Uncharacterized protein n=1 Tax=Parelaphostrongylus tenuis TaxID=148309 RepID=A0AAD5MN91_PARTN|nr:hypothetical protein KIN20_020882 [Parelaphostrongylus tenuis]